jgi:hypothetical protein
MKMRIRLTKATDLVDLASELIDTDYREQPLPELTDVHEAFWRLFDALSAALEAYDDNED